MIDFKSHLKQFDTYLELAKNGSIDVLEAAYEFIKEIAPAYYYDNDMARYYALRNVLMRIEHCTFKEVSLVDLSKYPFNPYIRPDMGNILDRIVWEGRVHLMMRNGKDLGDIRSLSDLPFDGNGIYASRYIESICDQSGTVCIVLKFFPGFSYDGDIDWNYQYIGCNIITINSVCYLVDIALPQFFHKHNNHPDRLGILGLEGPSVGYYMMRLKGGEEIARELCTKGYIELDDNVFKTYMDAFMLAFRNGLYYEENGIVLPREGILSDSSYLPYGMDEYMRLLFSSDSQVKYEGGHCLGRQRKPGDPNNSIFR